VTQSEPRDPTPGTAAAADALAGRLLATRRVISSLNVESEVRMRLHLRLIAICAALKVPGAIEAHGARRLDRLMADAERAPSRNTGRPE